MSVKTSKYTIMLGHEIERVLKLRGLNKTELARLICTKHPVKPNGKERNEDTTRNNITNIIKGTSIHADTLNLAFEVLKVEGIELQI